MNWWDLSKHLSSISSKIRKKENIAFQAEEKGSADEGKSSDDESLVLLTKNFNKFLKRMNRKNISQSLGRSNNFQQNKKPMSIVENKKQSKGIQCRECEGFGHIQSKCVNNLEIKRKISQDYLKWWRV